MFPLLVAIAVSQTGPADQDIVAQLPNNTRLIIGLNTKKIGDSTFAKRNAASLKALFEDWSRCLSNLGIEYSAIDKAWIAIGDGYPRNVAILITGKIDPAKVHAKMQQHIRERRYSIGPMQLGEQTCYSMETPIGLNPLPGLSPTIFVGVRENAIVISFDRDGLAAMVKMPHENKSTGNLMNPFKEELSAPTAIVCVGIPDEALTAPGSLMAGINRFRMTGELDEKATLSLQFHVNNANEFQNRLTHGLEQAEQIFPPLAQQQKLDPRLIRLVQDVFVSRKIVAEDEVVKVTMELSAQELNRALQK